MIAARSELRGWADRKDVCAEHAGLAITRCADTQAITSASDKAESRDRMIDRACKASTNAHAIYAEAYRLRECDVLGRTRSVAWFQRSLSPLAIGLGNSMALEQGVTLHWLYGTPLIPGSALKGLARSFATDSAAELNLKHNHIAALFGDGKQAACVDFLDGWITPDCVTSGALFPDVITPHHQAYMSGKEEQGDILPPADWDDPIPIPFLSAHGCYRFGVVWLGHPKDENADGWLEFAKTLLATALRQNGIGGKTAAGYGYFDVAESEVI